MKKINLIDTPHFINKEIALFGWVDVRRNHGKLIFLELRDRTATIQLIVSPEDEKLHALAETIRPEWVLHVLGTVVERPADMKNPGHSTGDVELRVRKISVLSQSQMLPFDVRGDGHDINEEIRLQYRYLDLRRPRMKNNIMLRACVIKKIRDFLTERGFIEIETPILTKSTPEGARDYVVPSRIYSGNFYALPQSPQQYKQLLMVAGFEYYFQISRCFRDEDTRGDRQPEFTQLDLEMSFVDKEDILQLTEELYIHLIQTCAPGKHIKQIPFPRMTYAEAMKYHSSDRPDLRENKNDSSELAFAFVVDFPMFERKDDGSLGAVHHPFTKPRVKDADELKKSDPLSVLAEQYDLVLNGNEIGGGSIRTHDPALLQATFEILGYNSKEIEEKFGHLLAAFSYGVPPHGGIAPGIDRFLMILAGEPNIREVIAFPKTGEGFDPMMRSPSAISPKQLKDLHIKIEQDKK